MPLGFERLNERTQRPNAYINFIKPLTSSSAADQAIARDFLERIAAQCYPVMKRDYLSVMSLEEYPPNREFLGRNFSAGEVIQLVLKDRAGRWLPFNYVQMVMMHELAHCKQMNHSRFFWQVRNRYADHMKELWQKNFTGEGLWGRGQSLLSGQFVHDRMPDNSDIPEHLCGGTYRRAQGKKRKRGGGERPSLSYAERQQKRIARKFGRHGQGQDLGEDEMVRGAIETMKGGKRQYGKPRVASSKRGRELRANAALARLEAMKAVKQEDASDAGEVDGSETEWSGDEYDAIGGTLAFDGRKIKDEDVDSMFRVCGDEAEQEEGYQDEMTDLQSMVNCTGKSSKTTQASSMTREENAELRFHEDPETDSEDLVTKSPSRATANIRDDILSVNHETSAPNGSHDAQFRDDSETEVDQSARNGDHIKKMPSTVPNTSTTITPNPDATSSIEDSAEPYDHPTLVQTTICPICSLENESMAPTCITCAHVLKPELVPDHWQCNICTVSEYVNAGDAGLCGLCGSQRHLPLVLGNPNDRAARPIGVVEADILRWD